ncbi:hypothetical protein C8R43DRAFT_931126 [Mycena crocata]|nr:hypothetical protein C8R43DRAFT_931126 [Mycena crocata]
MTRSARNLESQGLSTSRISRLLRPLRTKCIALAAIHSTPCVASTTYGSKACLESHPLDILPPPDSLRSYHIEHRSVANLRAALYAVRDCFRDVIVKTKPAEGSAPTQRVTRLADLCSIIVGENMQGEEDLGDGAEDDSELEQVIEMENLYGIIPVQYRRSALLAHALDIILRCPHHITLLSILLDVCLQHDLYHESCVLLHCLLQAAVSPVSVGSVSRLCHPSHSNYLVELQRKWEGVGRPNSVFIRLLTEALAGAPRPELWCCKAIGKFTRELHSRDFTLLMYMAGQLVISIVDDHIREGHENDTFRRKRRAFDTDETSLSDALNRWLNYSSSFRPSHSPDLISILEFLEQCRLSGTHRNGDSLAATVVCWATHYLSVTTAPGMDTLLKSVSSPNVQMYHLLVQASMTSRLQDNRASIQAYACGLRMQGLLLLEASLWACTLRFVETAIVGHTQKEVALYREELMDMVDDAERRCFGGRSHPHTIGSTPHSEIAGRITDSGWRWEEIVGCWIQCHLPPAKKVKHHHEPEHRSVNRCHDGVLTRTRRSSIPSPALRAQHTVMDAQIRGGPGSFELSFKSLISSALSNRTKLHSVREQETRTVHGALLPPHEVEGESISASDDALDLFAYT